MTLTGTPIENNVFDLYSQMDFLNPGMLGNVEFFKKEFAMPIDRDKDLNATKQLRKLVYPFILRRTKEEVAKELPEKMESVIFCDMEKQQRRVYDAFKDKYRDLVLGKIDSEGMNKAGVYILEGLMKLRQICDSPAILNEKEDFGHESVKMAELIPRIQEDSGRHKTLVFSQFLGMLDLIRKELDKLHIPYEYLDGSTTDRQERVERFQNNDSVRVFLMSLKAGGVGLNLTAADYVYIVDPWWNPAVEAQAIDRTHRIGQEKPVFAYKMICRDTVEEKILELQQKKKALAAATVARRCSLARTFFKDAVRRKLIAENPFDDVVGGPSHNPARQHFIDHDTISKVLEFAPTAEWKLLKEQYTLFNWCLNKVYRKVYDVTQEESDRARLLHVISLGFDRPAGNYFLYKWRKRQMRLAEYLFTGSGKYELLSKKIRRSKENLDQLVINNIRSPVMDQLTK